MHLQMRQCSASHGAPQLRVSIQLMGDLRKAAGSLPCPDAHSTAVSAATESGKGRIERRTNALQNKRPNQSFTRSRRVWDYN